MQLKGLKRKTYHNCDDLPLWNFIKLLTTDDLKYLLSDKDWYRMLPDLEDVWERIFMDYTERLNDPSTERTRVLIKRINLLESHITICETSIDLLTRVEDLDKYQPTILTLRSLLGVYAPFTSETLPKDLKTCIGKVKLMRMQYKQELSTYRELSKDDEKKASEADFTAQIVALEKYMGIPIDSRNISVAKYISYLSAIKAEK